jgi:hypothetical protein
MDPNETQKSTEKINSQPVVLRTFSSDLADAIKSGEASMVKIAMAEQKKKEAEYENFSPQSKKNKFFIMGSSVLVALGIIGIGFYFLYGRSQPEQVVNTTPQFQSLIYANQNKGYDLTDLERNQVQNIIQNEIKNASVGNNEILNMYFITKDNVNATKLNSQQFFTAIGASIPGRAARTLANDFMLGIHKGTVSDKNTPFILLNTTDYDSMYAGMLEWEPKMMDDFFIMFNISVAGDKNYLLTKSFQDGTFRNIDIRTLLDKDGNTVIMYGFINPRTVIITASQETFAEVMNRYNASRLER